MLKTGLKNIIKKMLDKRYYPVYNTNINYICCWVVFLLSLPTGRNIPFLFVEMILSYLYSLDKIWFYNVGSLIGSLFYLLVFFKCVIPNANPNILLISTSFISSINFNNCSLFIALYPLYL